MHENTNTSSSNATLAISKPRSCDICFKLKEKCTWTGGTNACDRCSRISKICTFTRIPRRMGRRPRNENTAPTSLKGAISKIYPSLQTYGTIFSNLNAFEQEAVGRFFQPEFFNSLMLVPREGCAMHQQAVYALLHNWSETRDACLSMVGAYANANSAAIQGYDFEENLARGSRALRIFRTMDFPLEREKIQLWLWLGVAIFVYAHCELASSASAVRKYLLGHLRYVSEQVTEWRSHPTVNSLIALDIHEALLYRRKPIMNMPSDSMLGPDTFLGLCAPLLRLGFDLAQFSHHYRNREVDNFALARIERDVDSWQPYFPSDWSRELSTVETTHVLSQSRVQKTMLLLYAHRLRYHFGQEDAAAMRMANTILSELDLAAASTGEAPIWVMTPFLVATMELTDVKERIKAISNVPRYGDKVSLQSLQLTKNFLKSIWNFRDKNGQFRWMDLMTEFPPLCLHA